MIRIIGQFSIGLLIVCTSCGETPRQEAPSTTDKVAKAKVNQIEIEDAPLVPKIEVAEESPGLIEKPTKSQVKEETTKAVVPRPKSTVQSKPNPKLTPPKAPKTFANIAFDKTIHEFGEIDEGDKITYRFKFKNTGNGPLTIDNVDVSCGCTMPTYPIIPIGPGETGEIGVIYNSKGKFGTQKPSITVKTNAVQSIVKLYLSGSIKHVFEKTTTDTTETKG